MNNKIKIGDNFEKAIKELGIPDYNSEQDSSSSRRKVIKYYYDSFTLHLQFKRIKREDKWLTKLEMITFLAE